VVVFDCVISVGVSLSKNFLFQHTLNSRVCQ